MTANDVIMQLAEAMRPIVASIEAKPAITKNRYDQYMAAISHVVSTMPGQPKTVALVAAVAMTYAGGNRDGIKAAMQAMGYLP